ncbi:MULTISPECIES: hypothetical protein [unclassified Paenibacillus]|uniref:hypothetical protein n=1 Tax=unclassified Paenibacillus TaxID=185978 RepID=UPI00277EBF80|nr:MULTISPECIES: hypothetical protein [unclassified Paenibacillus]MDQ0896253.1 hypothetical protein [Paenibacillus sp. V4I7]MDQ0913819.1 hypothetical protein [Paenibacillus sp. V4I5]
MKTEMGELIVGAYLKQIEGCDFVEYNARPRGGGIKGLDELDVIGMNFATNTAYLCEVTTHLLGALYVDNKTTVEKISSKHLKQKEYAETYLKNFENIRFMFWSPYVPIGYITRGLETLPDLELIINKEYTSKINELKFLARKTTNDSGNDFFRALQIIEHLK